MSWRRARVAADGTHHVSGGAPLYPQRFGQVLAYHEPGLAPVAADGEAWHIDEEGNAAYPQRFRQTFGFYEGRAAVEGEGGWHHIQTDGTALYLERYMWCGNYQLGRCTVRGNDGRYRHLGIDGKPVYAETWRYAGDFRDGVAVVQADDGRHTHIDERGSLVHGKWFLDLDVFHKGFARARDDFGWHHVDVTGQAAYARRFAMVEPFYNGQARVERFDGALEVIDSLGQVLLNLRLAPHSEPTEGRVLARTAWGRVQLVEAANGKPFVTKWTRGSNDREVEVLLELRGQPGVPALLGRKRCDMNDRLAISFCPGDVVGQPRHLRARPEAEAVRITLDLLDVCARAHDAGWVHTDIHPGNVLDGSPATLLDFACAVRATKDEPWRGEINWGVWEYVPPEQLCDYGELTPAADVYSAAALCLAMLCGAPPFRVEVQRHFDVGGWSAVREAFLGARESEPSWPVRPALLQVLLPALSLDPMARPTARHLAKELSNV